MRMARREKLKAAILEAIWNAFRKGNGQLLRDLGDAVDEQRRDPRGHDPLAAAILARKLRGQLPATLRKIKPALKAAKLIVPSDTHLKRIQKALGAQPQGGKPGHPVKKQPGAPPPSIGDLRKVFQKHGLLVPKARKPGWSK